MKAGLRSDDMTDLISRPLEYRVNTVSVSGAVFTAEQRTPSYKPMAKRKFVCAIHGSGVSSIH